ncbi:MAG: lysophospholipid acyltransferase family protein [Myxococcaceae bacterium]
MPPRPPRPAISGVNPVSAFFATLLVRAVAALSERARVRLASLVAGLVWTLRIRRRVTMDNLTAALPASSVEERVRIAKGAYRSMALGVVEALAGVRQDPSELDRKVEVENWSAIEPSLRSGKGVLVATAHFGNWELLGEVMARRGVRLAAVVKPLKGAVNAKLVEARQQAGLQLILARGALKATLKALGEGYTVAMLVDQVLPAKHGVFVPFFGRPACTNPALSVAAQRTGAPVFVAMGAREGEKIRVFIEGPFAMPDTGDRDRDVREHTAQITSAIERYIRKYPDQWLWLHRRWKVQPER